MTITRHLDDATLMSFAAGSLPAALAAVAAAHVAMCARCRNEVVILERIGGALMVGLPAMKIERAVPARPEAVDALPAPSIAVTSGDVPAPLVRLVGGSLDEVRWRWIAPGLWLYPLPVIGAGSLHLIRGTAGTRVPEHGHGGDELTLVLRGALIDSTGRYGPGDVADLDAGVEHAPAAHVGGCICAVASERPSRFRSLLARLLRPWHGM